MANKLTKEDLDTCDTFEDEYDEAGSAIKPYEVDCLPNDYNITSLISLIDRGYLRIPSFQRNYVWKRDMASKLIESIVLGLPIPQIFLFEKERNNFLVIDGQQRIVTIYLFRKKRFPKNDNGRSIVRKYLSNGKLIPDNELSGDDFEDFKLKLPATSNDTNVLDGLNYDTLPTSDPIDFKGAFDFNRTIRTITIKQIEPSSGQSSMFEIFSRLNSGGIMLKPQEIRMSMFYSDFYEKIVEELNHNTAWRQLLGKKDPDLHMREVEVIVRVFAMLEHGGEYRAPMCNFLNIFSEQAMSFNQLKIEELSDLFLQFMESCSELPTSSFKNDSKKFVISLFDAVFVAVCEKIRSEGLCGRKITIESIQALKANSEFTKVSQGNTAGAERVSRRLSIARETVNLQ